MNKMYSAFVALGSVVLLVVLGWAVLYQPASDAYRLPVIAIFAMAAMFAMLAFMAAVYQSASLSAGNQALGLPEGSVRALIALSLIVIFAVITLYMLSPQPWCKELANVAGKPAMSAEALALLKERQQSAQELAKQLLTMLGTLLAAVSSFYFGSSSSASAQNAAVRAMNARGGEPPPPPPARGAAISDPSQPSHPS